MYTITSEGGDEPITLAQACAHLKMNVGDDDDVIEALTSAARELVESYTGRELMQRTYAYSLDAFPIQGSIYIDKAPVKSVSAITYIDVNGDTQTVDDTIYGLDADNTSGCIYLKYGQSWPAARSQTNSVIISINTGYAPDDASPQDVTANIPKGLISAIKIILRDLYDSRGGTLPIMSEAARSLIAPYRRWKL